MFGAEAVREDLVQGVFLVVCRRLGCEEYHAVFVGKVSHYLAAYAAWHAVFVGYVGSGAADNGNGKQPAFSLADRVEDGVALGADGGAEGRALDVHSRVYAAGVEERGGGHVIIRIWRI